MAKAEVEVSGKMTEENLCKIIRLDVDYVSSGALTHSAPIMDISLKKSAPYKTSEGKKLSGEERRNQNYLIFCSQRRRFPV